MAIQHVKTHATVESATFSLLDSIYRSDENTEKSATKGR